MNIPPPASNSNTSKNPLDDQSKEDDKQTEPSNQNDYQLLPSIYPNTTATSNENRLNSINFLAPIPHPLHPITRPDQVEKVIEGTEATSVFPPSSSSLGKQRFKSSIRVKDLSGRVYKDTERKKVLPDEKDGNKIEKESSNIST